MENTQSLLWRFELSKSLDDAEVAWPTNYAMRKRLRQKISYYAKKSIVKSIWIGVASGGVSGVLRRWEDQLSKEGSLSDVKILYSSTHDKATLTMEKILLEWASSNESWGEKIVHDLNYKIGIEQGDKATTSEKQPFVLYIAF